MDDCQIWNFQTLAENCDQSGKFTVFTEVHNIGSRVVVDVVLGTETPLRLLILKIRQLVVFGRLRASFVAHMQKCWRDP
jgi:hypothetical protein